MISIFVYKILHLTGIFMLMTSLGGLTLHRINGGTRDHAWRKPVAITHGIGMFLVLLGGFGMLARLGIHWPWPGWIIGKVIIWLIFGGAIAVILRKPRLAKPLWWGLIALGAVAAYLAIYQPF